MGPVALGTTGQVLTMVGGRPAFATSGTSGTVLGARLAYASPAGVAVAAAPIGFASTTGRLIVTLPGGDATWISLTAGADGQLITLINNDAANTLTLSAAGFPGSGLMIGAKHRALIYYDGTDLSWEVASG